MCKTPDNKYKFSFGEMISSGASGKTSATGAIGVILSFLSMIIILGCVIFYYFNVNEATNVMDIIDRCIVMLGIGAALLGCRKVVGGVNSKQLQTIISNMPDEKPECLNEQKNDEHKLNEC